jgi:hypothetical protein
VVLNYNINHYYNIMDNIKTVLFIIIIWLAWITYKILNINRVEGLEGSPLDSEALQNIAAVYNVDKLKVSELEVTGNTNLKNTTIGGNATVTGTTSLKNTTVGGNATINGSLTANASSNLLKAGEKVVITTKGNSHEGYGKYVGFCGYAGCGGMVNYGITGDKSRGLVTIDKY